MTCKRRGYTLIEMVVVAVLSALVLGTAVAATALVVGMSGIVSREVDSYHDLARLATVFRNDAHQATKLTTANIEATVGFTTDGTIVSEMELPDGKSVRYRVHDGLIREVLQDGRLVARDGFDLDHGQRVLVKTYEENSQMFAHLIVFGSRILDRGDEAASQQQTWEVYTAVGRDRVLLNR